MLTVGKQWLTSWLPQVAWLPSWHPPPPTCYCGTGQESTIVPTSLVNSHQTKSHQQNTITTNCQPLPQRQPHTDNKQPQLQPQSGGYLSLLCSIHAVAVWISSPRLCKNLTGFWIYINFQTERSVLSTSANTFFCCGQWPGHQPGQ